MTLHNFSSAETSHQANLSLPDIFTFEFEALIQEQLDWS